MIVVIMSAVIVMIMPAVIVMIVAVTVMIVTVMIVAVAVMIVTVMIVGTVILEGIALIPFAGWRSNVRQALFGRGNDRSVHSGQLNSLFFRNATAVFILRRELQFSLSTTGCFYAQVAPLRGDGR